MDVHINEMRSRLDLLDTSSLMEGGVMETVIRRCTARVLEELAREKQKEAERQLRPSASSREGSRWE